LRSASDSSFLNTNSYREWSTSRALVAYHALRLLFCLQLLFNGLAVSTTTSEEASSTAHLCQPFGKLDVAQRQLLHDDTPFGTVGGK